jgi:two-component system cell cycle sensor histidine kinase/response regulator CckA
VEALRIAADPSLNISVLVTDVVMPKMSGDELAQRLERSRPGLRTLFVSGYAFDHQLGADIPSGARVFLRKPYTPEELCRQVARLVNATATPK